MRIIADKKDYYDCMQSTDQERTTLYIRKPEEIRSSNPKDWKFAQCPYAPFNGNDTIYLIQHVIGFCGKIFTMLEFSTSNWTGYAANDKKMLCWNIDQVDAFMNIVMKDDLFEKFMQTKTKGRHLWKNSLYKSQHVNFKRYFEDFEKTSKQFVHLFESKRCPVFHAYKKCGGYFYGRFISRDDNIIVYNALLKDVEFFRIFPPAQAYQEIMMWINNQVVPQKPMPVIDDVTMAEIKGFDKVFSFRKDPIRKKRK